MNDGGGVTLAENADPQAAPVQYEVNGKIGLVKVDHAILAENRLLVAGWTSDPTLPIDFLSPDGRLETTVLRRAREDVASGLQRPLAESLGFICVVRIEQEPNVRISFGESHGNFVLALSTQTEFSTDARLSVAPGVYEVLKNCAIGTREWRSLLSILPDRTEGALIVEGIIDVACSSPLQPNGFATGWITQRQDVMVWLEDDRGGAFGLENSYRWSRTDVREQIHHLPARGQKTGFHTRARFSTDARSVRICAANEAGTQRLAARPLSPLPFEGRAVVKALIMAETPRFDLPERIRQVDLPVIESARSAERKVWASVETRTRVVGPIPETPEITVVVPLYGRLDLIEHQLLEFDRDPDFIDRVEVIYVVDDPSLESSLHYDGPRIQAVSGPGFTWVTSGENRGFSGANNLGASAARGEVVIFMNSDVFPIHAGWASSLADILVRNPQIGLVAPRLLFENGSIQHAGMTARWRNEWGLYTNHHPRMGMPTEFDTAEKLIRTPLVTGACIALRKETFDRIGGWDEGFISGDFEDSDLCLRIREIGLDVAYDPTVELTHLERQSIDQNEDDNEQRERVTLVNACRYNQRWHRTLREIAS